MDWLWIYVVIVNACTFCIYGLDKWKARRDKYRISERTLLLLAAIGGTVGAYVGMYLFHHKTKKAKFYLGVPFLFLLQVFLVLVLCYYR